MIIQDGTVSNGGISLSQPLALPDGARVRVTVETVESEPTATAAALSPDDFMKLPFFGQWADRADIGDSADYVRREREKWRERLDRQD